MPRTQYRYEIEATRLREGKCPICAKPLLHYPQMACYKCPSNKCNVYLTEADYHREGGWAIVRGVQDNRPQIMPTPEET